MTTCTYDHFYWHIIDMLIKAGKTPEQVSTDMRYIMDLTERNRTGDMTPPDSDEDADPPLL